MADKPAQNSAAERRPDGMPKGTPFEAGKGSPNPGGRPKALKDIERMLDAEHRDAEKMKEVFERLRALALGQVVTVTGKDGETDVELDADPAYMKLYLERVMGPVKDLEPDLADAPDEVLRWFAQRN